MTEPKAVVGNCSFSELGLRGQVVLITGAGRGLGRAYAEIISEAGASVVVQDAGVDEEGENPNPACAVEVADALKAKGRSALAVFETLGDFRSCSEVVAVAHGRMGRLDGQFTMQDWSYGVIQLTSTSLCIGA